MQDKETATQDDFSNLSQVMADYASFQLNSDGEVLPFIMAIGAKMVTDPKDGIEKKPLVIIPVAEFHDERLGGLGKAAVAAMLQRMAEDPDNLLVGYAAESWVTKNTDMTPSDDPLREECVFMTILSAEYQAFRSIPMLRKDGKVSFGEDDGLHFPQAGKEALSGQFVRNRPSMH